MTDNDSKKSDSAVVALAKKRFKRLYDAESDLRALARADREFHTGDSDNLLQWPQAVAAKRKAEGKPILTIPKSRNHVSLVVNPVRENPPSAQILAATDGDLKAAQMMAGLVRHIETQSNAKAAYVSTMSHITQGGHGGWYYTYGHASPDSFDYEIKVNPVADPDSILVDPNKKFGFVFEDLSKEEFEDRYPKGEAVSFEDDGVWYDDKEQKVRIALYWFCESIADELLLLQDGRTVYKSLMQTGNESLVVAQRATTRESWQLWKISGGDKPLEKQDWPGSMLPIVFVEGETEIISGKKYRKGLVRSLKDPARMLNYWASEATHHVAMQNKAKFAGPAEHWEAYGNFYQNPDSPYLPTVSFNSEGQPIPPPTMLNPPQMATAYVQGMEYAERQFGQSSGQYEAQFGAKSNESSGRAINARKAQSETANYHYLDAIENGIVYGARVMVDLIQKTYDTERVVTILGVDNSTSYAKIDPQLPTAYQSNEMQDGTIEKLFNPKLLKCDIAIGTGPSYRTQREGAQDALTQILPNMPALSQAAPDLLLKAFDLPHADLMAQRMKKMLPPNLLEGEESDDALQKSQVQIAELQQQIEMMMAEGQSITEGYQQLQQALQQAQEELQRIEVENLAIKQDASLKNRELDIKQLEVEAKLSVDQQPVQNRSAAEPQQVAQPQTVVMDTTGRTPATLEQIGETLAGVGEVVAGMVERSGLVLEAVAALAQTQTAIAEQITRPKESVIEIDLGNGRVVTGRKVEQT